MQREIIKHLALSALLSAAAASAAVDPDLFDGRLAAEAAEQPAPATPTTEPATGEPRDLSKTGSIGGGEAVQSGSSKQAAGAGSSGAGSAADGAGTDGSAGGAGGDATRDYKDFGLGGVSPGETVAVQSSKQPAGGPASGGATASGTPSDASGGSGSAGATAPTSSGSGDYGSDLPTGL